MKKKFLALTLLVSMSLTACGEQAPVSTNSESSVVTETSTTETTTSETSGNLSELDALGSIEVEKNLFDVTLTIPKDYVGDKTQDDLNKLSKEMGCKSITLNEDGSATYVMTKAQHAELMDETRTSINSSLAEMVGSDEYPNFTNIEANDDFTEFTITTKSTKLDLAESFSVIGFYMYGGMYAIFSGTEVENISVKFINADTGEVINETNSSDTK